MTAKQAIRSVFGEMLPCSIGRAHPPRHILAENAMRPLVCLTLQDNNEKHPQNKVMVIFCSGVAARSYPASLAHSGD